MSLGLKSAFRDHKELLYVGGVYALLVLSEAFFLDVPALEYVSIVRLVFSQVVVSAGCAFVILLSFCLCLYFYCLYREASPAGARTRFKETLQARLRNNAIAQGLAGLTALQALDFLGPHKSMIPRLNPFHWDPLFAKWDALLHFGQQPFQLLAQAVDRLHLGKCLVASYYIWFFVAMTVVTYCLFCDDNRVRRMQFLWAYLLSWIIIGSFMALSFSSAGPIFFNDFYPSLEDPFSGMHSYLSSVSEKLELRTFRMRDMLLRWAHDKNIIDLNGISAMPSMHVAVVWLQVLYLRTVSRPAFLLSIAFFLLILAGSVYLGYHYLIDGYVAILLSTIIWCGARNIAQRLYSRR